MQPALTKGLQALSTQEVVQLLSHPGLEAFVPDLQKSKVGIMSPSFCKVVVFSFFLRARRGGESTYSMRASHPRLRERGNGRRGRAYVKVWFCMRVCQITGAYLKGTNLEELKEISPSRTRVEYELLLHTIRDIEAASQVSSW